MSQEPSSSSRLKYQPDGRLTRMGSPDDWPSRLRNLGHHLVEMVQPHAYVLNPPHPNRPPIAHKKFVEEHGRGMAQLHAILAPAEESLPWGTLTERCSSARVVLNRWQEVVIEATGKPNQIKAAIELAEKLITKCPVASACYVGECIEVMCPGEALTLLGRAMINVTGDSERKPVAGVLKLLAPKAVLEMSAPRGAKPGERTRRLAKTEFDVDPILTKSQAAMLTRLLDLGRLYFSGAGHGRALKLRAQPLIVAPTGCGKTFLVSALGKALGARVLRLTRGDWTIQHSRYGVPSLFTILDQLAELSTDTDSCRLIVVIDELDKMREIVSSTHEWTAALANEIFGALDRIFPVDAWREGYAERNPGKIIPDDMDYRIQRNLWFVGCGTFQDLFDEHCDARSMGFSQGNPPAFTPDAILVARVIPPELALRFVIEILAYPTQEETADLLHRFGLMKLAADAGETLTPDSIDWRAGGMRSLEALYTKLLLKHQAGPQSKTGPAKSRGLRASLCE